MNHIGAVQQVTFSFSFLIGIQMFSGRRKLLPGWCGCLSEHPLPFLLRVCELYVKNDLNYLSEINTCISDAYTVFSPTLAGSVRRSTLIWQLTIIFTGTDPASKPPLLLPVQRTHWQMVCWWASETMTPWRNAAQYKVAIHVLWTKPINLDSFASSINKAFLLCVCSFEVKFVGQISNNASCMFQDIWPPTETSAVTLCILVA